VLAHGSKPPKSLTVRGRCLTSGFNSGAGELTSNVAELLPPRNFGSREVELSRAFRFREVFPASQDPASERDPRLPSRIPEAGQARAGLSPISFPKRNGEPSVSGTGSAAQNVTDSSTFYHGESLFPS